MCFKCFNVCEFEINYMYVVGYKYVFDLKCDLTWHWADGFRFLFKIYVNISMMLIKQGSAALVLRDALNGIYEQWG